MEWNSCAKKHRIPHTAKYKPIPETQIFFDFVEQTQVAQ
jgi:hypothetical protein